MTFTPEGASLQSLCCHLALLTRTLANDRHIEHVVAAILAEQAHTSTLNLLGNATVVSAPSFTPPVLNLFP